MNRIGLVEADRSGPLTERQIRTLEGEVVRELRRLIAAAGDGASSLVALAELNPASLDATIRDLPVVPRRKAIQLLAALSRMAAGSYGVCVRCKNPISFERLEVMPETVWCRSCSPDAWAERRPVA
ncbi:MAG: TraR/DksA C4-type zinc finger protein [Gemmatimonadota bacterium]